MPTLDRAEIEKYMVTSAEYAPNKPQNRRGGQEETVGRKRRPERRTPEESERLIREFIWKQKKAVTFIQICDHLERGESAIFRRILDRMVESGEVIKETDWQGASLIPRYKYLANR